MNITDCGTKEKEGLAIQIREHYILLIWGVVSAPETAKHVNVLNNIAAVRLKQKVRKEIRFFEMRRVSP